jgi:hypothetical protein
MKKRFTSLLLFSLLFIQFHANGQTGPISTVFFGGHISTQGLGLEVKVAPLPEYAIRVGASILPIHFNSIYSIRSQPTDLNLKADFANAHLMFDLHPFLKEEGLSQKVVVTIGGAYFWKAGGDAIVTYRGIYNYGDIPLTSNELGELHGSVRWNKIAPYAGFGFENALSAHRFNISFAIGTYFMGAPDVTLTGTKLLVKNQSNEEQFRENMSYYRFLPVIQVNLNFGL